MYQHITRRYFTTLAAHTHSYKIIMSYEIRYHSITTRRLFHTYNFPIPRFPHHTLRKQAVALRTSKRNAAANTRSLDLFLMTTRRCISYDLTINLRLTGAET